MKIYLVYTHDVYDCRFTRLLRGITTDINMAEGMRRTLIDNGVEDEANISIMVLNDGDFDDCGGWLH